MMRFGVWQKYSAIDLRDLAASIRDDKREILLISKLRDVWHFLRGFFSAVRAFLVVMLPFDKLGFKSVLSEADTDSRDFELDLATAEERQDENRSKTGEISLISLHNAVLPPPDSELTVFSGFQARRESTRRCSAYVLQKKWMMYRDMALAAFYLICFAACIIFVFGK